MAAPAEIHDTGRITGDTLAAVVQAIRHTHLSISDRVFAAVGPAATPIRAIHDGLSHGIYGTVAGAHYAAPRAAAAVTNEVQRRSPTETAPPWRPTSRTARMLGALNGLKGDTVAEDYAALAFPMALRDHINADHINHGDVALTRDGLAAAYPDATDKLVVFVHGLCETDRSWWDGSERHHGEPSISYGTLLRDELGYTPLYLRYNSGLPVVHNGREFAELLTTVVDQWPTEISDIVFVGHSMGGLIARSACYDAEAADLAWLDLVRHVICVGTPHLGAPLEKSVHRLVPVLERIPETQPLAHLLRTRSAGVKDLRHGVFASDEYHGDDAHEYLAHRRREIPFVESITYCFVGATITRDPRHPLGQLVGDLLVRYPSAAGIGRSRSIPFELEHGAHVGGLHHFDLLNHPTVYAHLRRWLTTHQ